jgi:hypothetical protein
MVPQLIVFISEAAKLELQKMPRKKHSYLLCHDDLGNGLALHS